MTMPNPILAPEYWVDKAIEAVCQKLERWAALREITIIDMTPAETAELAQYPEIDWDDEPRTLIACFLRDNRLEIIASVTKPGGE